MNQTDTRSEIRKNIKAELGEKYAESIKALLGYQMQIEVMPISFDEDSALLDGNQSRCISFKVRPEAY